MRSAIAAFAVTAVLYGAFVMLELRRGDISRFVVAGDEFSHPDGVTVEHSAGYDGQFYLRLALRPMSTAPVEQGIRFDYPVYRAQRIVYPLIVHALSFGSTRATLWLLVLLNVTAVCAVSAVGALLLEHYGVAGVYGIVIALFPSFLLTVRRDLTEAVELAFALAAILAMVKQRWLLTALLLAIAALSKEPSLLVPGAALAMIVIDRNARRLWLLIAPAVYFGWKLWLFHHFDLPVTLFNRSVLGVPFATVAPRIAALVHPASRGEAVVLIELALLALFALLVAIAFRKSRAAIEVKLAWLGYALLVTTLGPLFWDDDWSFLRPATELGVLGALIALTSTPLIRRTATTLIAGWWLFLAYDLLVYR
ncbi:MAG: hypothetical protein QOI24_4646 [Acidobacteriota bacterium]|jgi:hypothetical protein|nr:hypothetical protein [Acidobacteriota bacterium]